ncbi:ABC transporter substrate-binding protein [Diaminobutyricibacter sp. McL0618]|uniref:ABC transporter substrate-binding protein n=1 Tax=Leifsonia sp. McL0618 TaxID=3415677 RepID=UPI003CE79B05
MKTSRTMRVVASATLLIAGAATLAGCSNSGSSNDHGKTITVWSEENQPDRVKTTQTVIDAFTKKTGIKVKLVPVDEAQVPQLVASAAISGKLPDVMGAIPLSIVRQLDTQKLLNTDSAANVVKNLDEKTFVPSALKLDQDGSRQLAVPDSAYAQILVYRKDLFEKAGLEAPTTYAALEKAAKTLTSGKQYGITLATDPKDVFTSQTFESLALGNNCQLVDKSGKVGLESSECKKTWNLYGSLAQHYSPSGTQTVDTTRATYFAGQAAMVDWSTYILDELGGLRNDALPTCPQCTSDPTWLAKNSGIVTSIAGPDGGQGATYGEATSWLVTKKANASPSEKFIEYMLSDGYLKWLGMAPEGKFPLRTGTQANATEYTDGWKTLETGVDTKKKLSDIYDAATIDALLKVPSQIDRWAIPQGQGALLGPVNTQLPVSKAVASLGSGTSPSDAASAANTAVEQMQAKLK